MNKTLKKLLSGIIAASMLSASLSMTAGAASMTYSDGKLTYESDKAQTAVLLKAEYNDGSLEGVSVVNNAVELTEGTNTIDVVAEEGDKLFLWDSLSNVVPLADALEIAAAEETPTPLPSWKFDFGSAEDVAEGYTAVTADRNYVTTQDYGFLGIDNDAHKLSERIDAFGMQEGQVIELAAGGTTGLNDGIGSTGADLYGNAGDEYYPTRFALKVEDEQYFKVKATVTTLDPTKDAVASLYTERKHPIYKSKTIAAGETYTAEFTIRTTPIYYQKSEPQGTIADGMVNVAVLGENTALAALEIEQLETAPVMWVLGDSTVTDGNTTLPYFDLQNYTGVGTGLTKYLPSTMAMVNEGEGGLNAADSLHYNVVASRIKAGDYLYLEYGHNHKNDGTEGYLSCLDKYYNTCHNVGANLIIVSPIERINTFTDNAYQHSLRGFAEAGEQYVADKIANGATDIAYVDLNLYSLNFYNRICTKEDGTVDSSLIKFYFQTAKGGGTDTTHPNDAGADSLAYEFIKAAQAVTDETQKAVLAPILDNLSSEVPTLVPEEIIALGGPSNDAWPTYVPLDLPDLPVVIESVNFDPDTGALASVDVKTQQAILPMTAYGIIIVTVYDETGAEKGKLYAVDQVDNSTGYGSQKISNFTGDVTLGETDSYEAVVMQAIDSPDGLIVDEEANVAYSAVYKPTNIAKYLITDEDGETYEDFDYYGAVYEGDSVGTLTSYNGWAIVGSAGNNLSLGVDGDRKYARIMSDGAKGGSAGSGSFNLYKSMTEAVGSSGQYMISVDLKYTSGGDLPFTFKKGVTSSNVYGTASLDTFTIGSDGAVLVNDESAGTVSALDWTNVKYVLDMDNGTATVSVGGGVEKVFDIAAYQSTTPIATEGFESIVIGQNGEAFDVLMSNLIIAKLDDVALEQKTLTVSAKDNLGTVAIFTDDTEVASPATADRSSIHTIKATPNSGYKFVSWNNTADDSVVSTDAEYTVRLFNDMDVYATFEKLADVTDLASYKLSLDNEVVTVPAEGSTVAINIVVDNCVDANGNEVLVTVDDMEITVDEKTGLTLDGTTLTLDSSYVLDADTEEAVTIKTVINGIEKTATLVVNTYTYKEFITFDDADGSWAAGNWGSGVWNAANGNKLTITAPGRGGGAIIASPFKGNAYQFQLGANWGDRSGTAALSTAYTGSFVTTFDAAMTANTYLRLGSSYSATGADATGTFLVLNVSGGKLSYYDYATNSFVATGLAAGTSTGTPDTFVKVKAAVDIDAKTATVTLTDLNGTSETITLDLTNSTATGFGGLGVSQVSGGAMYITLDNITVR